MARHKRTVAAQGAWLVSEDESARVEAPKGRTWGHRGRTPVVTVTGGHNSRVSLAALIAVRPGERPRAPAGLPGAPRPARGQARGSPRRTTPGWWTPRTSSSAVR